VTSGLGSDYVLRPFHYRLALRLIQPDWQYSHVSFGALDASWVAGGTADLKDYRLASGIVPRFGSFEPALPPLGASCPLAPETVFVGDPVTVSVQTGHLNPKKTARYSWPFTGGTVSGSGETVTVDTKGLTAGSDTVTAAVVEGNKPGRKASYTASFTVQPMVPHALHACPIPTA
jgi:hypothetical protein